jgi:hypothetical protein
MSEPEKPAVNAPSQPHPLFGVWKGLITIAPGVDLTEPAFPEWAEIEKKYSSLEAFLADTKSEAKRND